MTERNYTVKLKDQELKVSSSDLAVFRRMHIGDSELGSRMSELIWLDIYTLDAAFGVSSLEILDAIRDVEGGEQAIGTKPSTQFRNQPLKGLFHKHYFSAHFLVQNMLLGLGKSGLEKLVAEVFDPKKSSTITREMTRELAHRVTHEPLEQRNATKRITGEWIIFIRHDGKNYYLCCNTHNAGDQFIYDRIAQHCVRDFPDLLSWLTKAQSELP